MYEVEEFSQMIDPDSETAEAEKKEPDILRYLQDCGHISVEATTSADLTRKELAAYHDAVARQRLARRHTALSILHRATRYSATQSLQYINGELAAHAIHNLDEPVYVIPAFLRPGKHCFLFSLTDEVSTETTLQSTITDIRSGEVPPFHKESHKIERTRTFARPNSVFAPWLADTPRSLR
jgi:hypothetical protein